MVYGESFVGSSGSGGGSGGPEGHGSNIGTLVGIRWPRFIYVKGYRVGHFEVPKGLLLTRFGSMRLYCRYLGHRLASYIPTLGSLYVL